MKNKAEQRTETEHLLELLKQSQSPFSCVEAAQRRLEEAGFTPLGYNEAWNLTPGGKYVWNHHGTTLFAWTVGRKNATEGMLRMAAAHTDYPCLRIKPNPDFQTNRYAQVNLEVYGGPILNTWLDRPLGVAGRVVCRGKDAFSPEIKLYCSKHPVMIIPNLAIHMNRDVNSGVEVNKQIDLMPILDTLPKEEKTADYFLNFMGEELGVSKEDILDFELNTYVFEEPCPVGVRQSMLSAPRLDNQTSVSALLSAIIDGEREEGINLIALFDHEEVGSGSKQGAASILLHDMCRRILTNLGASDEQVERTIYDAMLLSVDVAHALHPNKQGKMDITNHPVMGNGFCIKEACSQSYATDAEAIAILCQICDSNHIPYQRFVNRSDVRGGGTLGAIASTLMPIKTVDLGVPILAMHSARELMGTADMQALKDAVCCFFRI